MTKKQWRKWKKCNLERKRNHEQEAKDRPEWADEEKENNKFEEWRIKFLMECNPSYKKLVVV